NLGSIDFDSIRGPTTKHNRLRGSIRLSKSPSSCGKPTRISIYRYCRLQTVTRRTGGPRDDDQAGREQVRKVSRARRSSKARSPHASVPGVDSRGFAYGRLP